MAFLENAPTLYLVNKEVWESFAFLNERGRGFNGKISLESIINFMNEFEVENRPEFIYLITELDSYYRGKIDNGKSKVRN